MYGKLFWIDLRGAINGYVWFITDISSCLGIKLALSIILKHLSSESVINFFVDFSKRFIQEHLSHSIGGLQISDRNEMNQT